MLKPEASSPRRKEKGNIWQGVIGKGFGEKLIKEIFTEMILEECIDIRCAEKGSRTSHTKNQDEKEAI